MTGAASRQSSVKHMVCVMPVSISSTCGNWGCLDDQASALHIMNSSKKEEKMMGSACRSSMIIFVGVHIINFLRANRETKYLVMTSCGRMPGGPRLTT